VCDRDDLHARRAFPKNEEVGESSKENPARSGFIHRKLMGVLCYLLDRAVKFIQEHFRSPLLRSPYQSVAASASSRAAG
jgi:hypothetical protein